MVLYLLVRDQVLLLLEQGCNAIGVLDVAHAARLWSLGVDVVFIFDRLMLQ